MNLQKLKAAEKQFMQTYPGGFEHPEMVKIGKKHNMPKMIDFCHKMLDKNFCQNVEESCDSLVKIVNRSSMISMFEKPKFRDFVKNLNSQDKAFLVEAVNNLLHGKKQLGFEALVNLLLTEKLAKWSLVTIIPAYYYPTQAVFVKPTTAKNIIQFFEVRDLTYKPLPTWDFYQRFSDLINQLKEEVDPSLSPSNAAFSGFLMMSMQS